MRVLHLISSCGLFGAENVVLTLARNLNTRRAGHFIDEEKSYYSIVGAVEDARDPHLEIVDKAKQEGLPTFILKSRGRFDFSAVTQLKKYLLSNKIALLHTHNYKSDVLGFAAARLAGIPIVATAHGYTDMDRKVTIYEKLDRWILRRFFNKVAVVTDKMLPGFPERRRTVIPNGLNVERFSKLKEENAHLRIQQRRLWGIDDDKIIVATIGRLSKEKNQALLLQAAAQLSAKHDRIHFVIVGAGPEEERLKQLAEDLKITDKTKFVGLIQDIAPVYQAIDVFVLTSLTEGVPITILEAMAAEVPIVATRVGGIPDLITDSQTGLLVNSGDVQDFSVKIELLLTQPNLGKKFSAAAATFVKSHFSQEIMVERYRRVYEEATEARKGKP